MGQAGEQGRALGEAVRELDLREAAQGTWSQLTTPPGHTATTLVKQSGLRVVLLVLRAGAEIPAHRAQAEITVQVLRGEIRFRMGADTRDLTVGRLLAVGRGLEHSVEAIEDAEVLLTLGGAA